MFKKNDSVILQITLYDKHCRRKSTENPLPRDTQVVIEFNTVHEPNNKRKAQTQCPSPKKMKYCVEQKKEKQRRDEQSFVENKQRNQIRDDLEQKLKRVRNHWTKTHSKNERPIRQYKKVNYYHTGGSSLPYI